MKNSNSFIDEHFGKMIISIGIFTAMLLTALLLKNNMQTSAYEEENIPVISTTYVSQTEQASAACYESTEWKNLDEDERIIKALTEGTNFLSTRELALYNEVVAFKNTINDNMKEIDIARAAYNWVRNKATYDKDAADPDNRIAYVFDSASSYGALVDGYSVCAGYAKAYTLLLRACDIDAKYVVGKSYGYGHGWTCAKIAGDFYAFDVTWDDNAAGGYDYFAVPDAYMSISREWDETQYVSCDSYTYCDERYLYVDEGSSFNNICNQLSSKGFALIKSDKKICELSLVADAFKTNIKSVEQKSGEYTYYTIVFDTIA